MRLNVCFHTCEVATAGHEQDENTSGVVQTFHTHIVEAQQNGLAVMRFLGSRMHSCRMRAPHAQQMVQYRIKSFIYNRFSWCTAVLSIIPLHET